MFLSVLLWVQLFPLTPLFSEKQRLHTVEVAGSNPAAPTKSTTYKRFSQMWVHSELRRSTWLQVAPLPAMGRADGLEYRSRVRVHSHLKRNVSEGVLSRFYILTIRFK